MITETYFNDGSYEMTYNSSGLNILSFELNKEITTMYILGLTDDDIDVKAHKLCISVWSFIETIPRKNMTNVNKEGLRVISEHLKSLIDNSKFTK